MSTPTLTEKREFEERLWMYAQQISDWTYIPRELDEAEFDYLVEYLISDLPYEEWVWSRGGDTNAK